MSDRVLRGSRLGSVSYESDRHTEFAPRSLTTYECELGHETAVPFAAEAEVPYTWECRVCGAAAERQDAQAPEAKIGKPARTHWDMLLERRSVAELEEVLAERLAVLHEQQVQVKAQLKADARLKAAGARPKAGSAVKAAAALKADVKPSAKAEPVKAAAKPRRKSA
jgi:hypothetical protein